MIFKSITIRVSLTLSMTTRLRFG